MLQVWSELLPGHDSHAHTCDVLHPSAATCPPQMLMATTGDGWLVPLLITESDGSENSRISAGPLPNLSEEQPIKFSCWYSSADPSSGIVNTGGTGMQGALAVAVAAKLTHGGTKRKTCKGFAGC
jgi:hypothetical protein